MQQMESSSWCSDPTCQYEGCINGYRIVVGTNASICDSLIQHLNWGIPVHGHLAAFN